MKMISIKEGHKTRYIRVPDDYEEKPKVKDRKTSVGDITCSGAKSVTMGFTQEQWERIFHKVDKSNEK